MQNADLNDVAQFEQLADQWWSANGPFKLLHELNPLRLQFVTDRIPLAGKSVLDVGCGGGILSEALQKAGAKVTGIDASAGAIAAAKAHDTSKAITYLEGTAEAYQQQSQATFDTVICMELLEHVPQPQQLVMTLSQLLKPGGALFVSTLNRTLKSFLLAIIGAEYILKLLPKGTHQYAQFIPPAELDTYARQAQLQLQQLKGIRYHLLNKTFAYTRDVSINYLAYYQKPLDL